MAAKKDAHASTGRDPLSEAMDRLYAEPLEEFVALRKELAGALRAAGELPASRLVATAAKPTRNAWALNQIARNHPELLRTLFDARGTAAAAQTRGDADEVRSSVREYRERLADVVRAARDTLARAGANLGPTQARRIGESLQAMSAGDDEVRAKLLAGRLTNDVETEDPFAGLEVGPPRAHARPHSGPHDSRLQQDDGAARKREAAKAARAQLVRAALREREQRERAIHQARERVAQLENKARDARGEARKAEVAAAHARSAAERARRAVQDAERQVEESRRELERVTK